MYLNINHCLEISFLKRVILVLVYKCVRVSFIENVTKGIEKLQNQINYSTKQKRIYSYKKKLNMKKFDRKIWITSLNSN